VYVWLYRRRLQTPWDTVRSGIHVRVAAWAAQRAGIAERPERAWAPELLIPVMEAEESDVVIQLGQRVAAGIGSIRLVGLRGTADLAMALQERAAQIQMRGVSSTSTCVDTDEFARGCQVVIDSLRGMFMGPNLVLLGGENRTERDLQILVDHCHSRRMGLGLFMPHPDGALGRGKIINVWLSERSPDWALTIHNANLDLPVLFGYLLARQPGARIRLATVVRAIEDRADAFAFLHRLIEQGRLPEDTETHVGEGSFIPAVQSSPYADVHLFGLPTTIDRDRIEEIRDASGGACVFLLDSGQESLLA
jgi:solute carrier family 12 sodium/potassium/chloride transporter 2